MFGNEPNAVDWLTLGAAGFAALSTAAISIWTVWHTERDKFSVHIDWKWLGQNYEYEELPMLYIQNRGDRSLLISEIAVYTGLYRRKVATRVALMWEDPMDLDFPYTIEPQAIKKLVLSEALITKHFEKLSGWRNLFGWLGRTSIWVGVTSISGTTRFAPAQRAVAWNKLPNWARNEDVELFDD